MGTRPRGWPRPLVGSVLLAVGYVTMASAGHALEQNGPLSVWYVPAGLALAAAMVWGWAALPALAVGEFLSGVLVFGVHTDFTVLQMLVNAVGYAGIWCAGAALLHARGVTLPLLEVRRAVEALAVALVATPALAATFGVTMRAWAGAEPAVSWPADALVWAVGDALGVATLAPALLVLALLVDPRRPSPVPAWWNLPRGALLAVLMTPTLVATVAIVLVPEATGVLTLTAIPVALVAVRLGVVGVAFAAVPLGIAVTGLARRQAGEAVLARSDLQVMLLGLVVIGLIVAFPADQARRLAQRLRRREEDLDEAQRLAGMGSFRWDLPTGEFRWSPGLAALFGRPSGWAPSNVDEYLQGVRADHRDEVAAGLQRNVEGGGPVDQDYPVVRTDGSHRWVTSHVEAVHGPDGAVQGLTGYCLDITDRRAAEDALRAAAEREHVAAEQLRQTEGLKDALLVAVSHEVRTPLTVLGGLAATLRRPEVQSQPELVTTLVDRLRHHVDRLHGLLTDLLDTDRLARGTIDPHLRATDVPALVDSVLTMHEDHEQRVDVDVEVRTALIDSGLVARILESLLVNALRYTGPDATVWVSARADDSALLLVVEDNGPGVPAGQRDAVFRAFHQGSRIEHSPGTGIGLSLVARFAELHGGIAWVEDRPGGGASFRVRLPGALTDDVATAGAPPGRDVRR